MNVDLAKGWIKPSSSPWGALIIFIRKKIGELRMTVSYRVLQEGFGLSSSPILRG